MISADRQEEYMTTWRVSGWFGEASFDIDQLRHVQKWISKNVSVLTRGTERVNPFLKKCQQISKKKFQYNGALKEGIRLIVANLT